MSRLLVIDSSPMGENSISKRLTKSFTDAWIKKNPNGQVYRRDVAEMKLPHLDGQILGAFFTPAQDRTADQQALVATSEELIGELKAADTIAIGVPMHNFGIPSTLKTYIDHVSRAGETFAYTENGPVGLIEDGKRVVVLAARGGDYSESSPAASMDFTIPYLKTVFGFLGIGDFTAVEANGLAMGEDLAAKAVEGAEQEIERIAA